MIAFKTFKVKKWYGYLENVIFSTFHGSRGHCQNFMIKKFIFLGLLSGFSLGHLHMGGTSAGGQSVNEGGLMRGTVRPYGGT